MKFTERILKSNNIAIKKRLSYLRKLDYQIFTQNETNFFDKNYPIATIILTVHDSKIDYIRYAIDSVLKQTYRNTEFIIIDHGTTDEIKTLLWSTFQIAPNSKLLVIKENSYKPEKEDFDDPIVNLWNAGLFCSEGDFVYFLSCDDAISPNYVELMVKLFVSNPNCISAAPSIISIDDSGSTNYSISANLAKLNQRLRYTDGFEIAESYISGTHIAAAPGGFLMQKSSIVIDNGGFDNMNDLSQIFKFAIFGISGFDHRATLYWRHHNEQLNKKQKKLGLVYYKSYLEFPERYNLYDIYRSKFGEKFVTNFREYITNLAEKTTLSSIEDSFIFYGASSGFKAIFRAYHEMGAWIFIKKLHKIILIYFKNIFLKIKKILEKIILKILNLLMNKVLNFIKKYSFVQRIIIRSIKRNRLHFSNLNQDGGTEITYYNYTLNLEDKNIQLLELCAKIIQEMIKKTKEGQGDLNSDIAVPFLMDKNNHYLFIVHLVNVLQAKQIVEIGTASGSSLWAWLQSPWIEKVFTYDLIPLEKNKNWFVSGLHEKVIISKINKDSRWQQIIGDLSDVNFFKQQEYKLTNADIIFIDGPHNGIFADKILSNLLKMNNSKDIILMFDDIRVSSMVSFWDNLTLDKLDVTGLAHQSGTGLALLPAISRRK